MLLGRSDRGLLAQWWFTVDRGLMMAVLLLMATGVLISMAASPPVADRIGLDTFHFFRSQLFYLFPAVLVLIGAVVPHAAAGPPRRLPALRRTPWP